MDRKNPNFVGYTDAISLRPRGGEQYTEEDRMNYDAGYTRGVLRMAEAGLASQITRPDPSRSEIAMAIMAGLAPLHDKFHSHNTAAHLAVSMADALRAALAKEPTR